MSSLQIPCDVSRASLNLRETESAHAVWLQGKLSHNPRWVLSNSSVILERCKINDICSAAIMKVIDWDQSFMQNVQQQLCGPKNA